MLRRFVRQGAVYLAGNLITRAVNFLTLPVYARVLLSEDLGIYELVMVFSAVAGIFVTLEISQGVARYLHEAKSIEEHRRYVSSAFWFTVIAYTVLIAISAFFARPISGWLLAGNAHADTFRFGLLACWANGLCYFALNQLRWTLRAREYALASVIQTIVSQLTALWLILGLGYGVNGLFFGAFVGGVVGFIVALYRSIPDYRLVIDWHLVREMLLFSCPLAASGLAVLVMGQVDRLVIKELLGITAVGQYGVAARFAAVASILLVGFQAALTPLVTSLRSDVNAPLHLAVIFRYFVASALPIVFILAVFSREFINLLGGAAYLPAHQLVPILAFSSLLAGMYVFAPGLWLAKKTKTSFAINTISALLSVFLAIGMVSALGLLGAALSTVLAAAVQFGLTYWIGQNFIAIPIEWKRIFQSFTIAVVSSAIAISIWGFLMHGWLGKLFFTLGGVFFILRPLISWNELKRIPSAFYAMKW